MDYSKIIGINDKKIFFEMIGIKYNIVTYILYKKGIDSFYEGKQLPKKDGGLRDISIPLGELKHVQKKIFIFLSEYSEYLEKNRNTRIVSGHAFIKGKSIITNAKYHINKRYVMNFDLKDFFPSIHFGRIVGYFKNNKNFIFSEDIAIMLAQLMCYKGALPQGTSTSPIMSNLILHILDCKLYKLAKKYKLLYTRYADDLTFSTNYKKFESENYASFVREFNNEITRAGFKLNENKTRIQYNNSRQEVTGLTVNKRINISREYYKTTRAMADSFYRNGTFYINENEGTIDRLDGRFSFIYMVDKSVSLMYKKKNKLYNHMKDYEKFCYYKTFYANYYPLIITEGKTDVRYLKAALMKHYKDYPELITKNGEKFIFSFKFFKRKQLYKDLLKIELDGADTLISIPCYANGKSGYINYNQIFNEISVNKKAKNPVIIILDNEAHSDRPLSKFLKTYNNIKEVIESDKMARIINNANYYLIVNDLVPGKDESEIEDLFDTETLSHIDEGGRRFNRTENYDSKIEYGKNDFSKYIISNFKNINFENFLPILDRIRKIIKEY